MMDGKRYERPPVEKTTLTVFIDPIENFDVSIIGRLQQRWSERYPALKQTAPKRRPSPPLPEVDLFGSGWPLPGIEQVASSLCRTVAYQHDQISLEWSFDPDAPDTSYPGFEALAKELNSLFSYFAELVQRFGDTQLRVEGCGCLYENRLDGVASEDWIANYLSGWQGVDSFRQLDEVEYIGFRLRDQLVNRELGTQRTTSVVIDGGHGVDATGLDIDVVSIPLPDADLGKNHSPEEVARILLDDAHQRLIETFEDSANDAMRNNWGVRK